MAVVDDMRRVDCGAKLRGFVCDLAKNHEGDHQAVMRWEPKLVGKAAAVQFMKHNGVHLHATSKAARAWKLVTKKPKQPCTPDMCIKFSK